MGAGFLMVALLIVAWAPSTATAKTYQYRVEVPAHTPFTEQIRVTINGRERTCIGTTCTWRSSDSSPSVKGCKKMRARINNQILAYGFDGRMLDATQLRSCNNGASPPSADRERNVRDYRGRFRAALNRTEADTARLTVHGSGSVYIDKVCWHYRPRKERFLRSPRWGSTESGGCTTVEGRQSSASADGLHVVAESSV